MNELTVGNITNYQLVVKCVTVNVDAEAGSSFL